MSHGIHSKALWLEFLRVLTSYLEILPMTSICDSTVVFMQRATQLGISAAVLQHLHDKQWDTFTFFGHASSYIPGQHEKGPDDTPFKEDILGKLGVAVDDPQAHR
eukprot:3833232-Amphidinium_carterae.1